MRVENIVRNVRIPPLGKYDIVLEKIEYICGLFSLLRQQLKPTIGISRLVIEAHYITMACCIVYLFCFNRSVLMMTKIPVKSNTEIY